MIDRLSSLALSCWQHALSDRAAPLFVIARRVERALGQAQDPAGISLACRELVRAGYAESGVLGYRARRVWQGELVGRMA